MTTDRKALTLADLEPLDGPLTVEEESALRASRPSVYVDYLIQRGWAWSDALNKTLATLDEARSQDTATARIATVLRLHYVTAIECDHETKMDTIRCNCSVWTGTPQPSVGAAVQEWVDHVLRAVLSGETRTGGAE